VDSPERSQHSHDSPCHDSDSAVPCCSAGSGSYSSSATSAGSAQRCPGVPLRTGISIMPNLSTFKATVARGSVRCTGPHGRTNWSHRTVLRVRRAWSLQPYALELLSGALKLLVLLWLVLVLLLLAITSCRASWTERGPSSEVKRGRVLLPHCPGVVAFLFSSPISLRMDSKMMALCNSCWKDGKV
jgi:hypothetical protein